MAEPEDVPTQRELIDRALATLAEAWRQMDKLAMAGNVKAAHALVSIAEARARILGINPITSPEVAEQEASDRPCPSQPEPKEPE